MGKPESDSGGEEGGARPGSLDRTSLVAAGGILAGLAVAMNHALAPIPNVELTSLTIFLSGVLLGSMGGALTGAAATVAFSVTNPMGAAAPPLLLAQVLGYGLWGAAGGRVRAAPGALPAALLAAALTLVFQALVNAALLVVSGLPPEAILVPAVPFVALHVGSNAVIFGALLPQLVPRLQPLCRRART